MNDTNNFCQHLQSLLHSHHCAFINERHNKWVDVFTHPFFSQWKLVDLLQVVFPVRGGTMHHQTWMLLHKRASSGLVRLPMARNSSINVQFARSPESVLKTVIDCMVKLIPGSKPQFHNFLQKESVFSVNPSNAFGLSDKEVKELLSSSADSKKPLFWDAIAKDLPPGYREIGICENNDFQQTTEEEEAEQKALRERITHAINKQLDNVSKTTLKKTGFTNETLEEYRRMLLEHWEAFGDTKCVSRMSDLTPFPLRLKPGCNPAMPRRRIPMTPEQVNWLKNHLNGMVEKGIISPVENPRHGSIVFLVPKKGPKKWRMVTDMVALNKITERTPLQMPLLEQMLANIGDAKIFATFDALSGFDLLRTTSDDFVLITPVGAFKMHCAPMGWINTPMIFQNRMEVEVLLPADLLQSSHNGAGQWIDDTCLYGTEVSKFINSVKRLLQQVIIKKVRLNIEKCFLLNSEVEWCGRLISHRSWQMHPKYYDRILKVGKPRYVDELQQAFYTAQWLSPTIPQLSKHREAFKQFLNLHGEKHSKVKRRNELVNWTPTLLKVWESFLKDIHMASKRFMANYSPNKGLGVMVDASDNYYSCVVVQLEESRLTSSPDFQSLPIKPLVFLSGAFTASALKWHISQKELFPILEAFRRFDFLLLTHPTPIVVFTDHKNLVHILRPEWVPNKSASQRLARWATQLQSADILAIHIPGKYNVIADLLSRWGSPDKLPEDLPALTKIQPERTKRVKIKLCTKLEPMYRVSTENNIHSLQEQLISFDKHRLSFLNPFYKGVFKQINNEEIRQEQNASTRKGCKLNKDTQLFEKDGKTFIPKRLLERFIVHNHIACYHGNFDTEMNYLSKYSFEGETVVSLRNKVRKLRQVCVHCQRTPSILKRPLQETVVPKQPRSVLTMDYLYIKEKNYLLVLTDVFSRKVCLHHTKSANAETAVKALLEFRGHFGLTQQFVLITDKGSHFANSLLQDLQTHLRFAHTFSVAYCPWQNGAAEVANRRILRNLRQLCSEFSLQLDDWVKTIPTIEHVINNFADRSKNGLSPNHIFMGFEHIVDLTQQGNFLVLNESKILTANNSERVTSHVLNLKQELENIAKKKYEYIELTRSKARSRANRTRKYVLQFEPGDWVLVSTVGTLRDLDKTRLKWSGPQLVTRVISMDVYEVQNLNGHKMIVHASRLWYYDNSSFRPTPEMTSVFNHDFSKYMVKQFHNHKEQDSETWLLTEWLGFERIHDSWEPLSNLFDTHAQDILTYFDKKKLKYPADLKLLLKSNQTKSNNAPVLAVFQKTETEKGTITSNVTPLAQKWLPKQWEDLRHCVLTFGVKRKYDKEVSLYSSFTEWDPYRALQLLMSSQELKDSQGTHLDIADLCIFKSFNESVKHTETSKVVYNVNLKNNVVIKSGEDVHISNKDLTTTNVVQEINNVITGMASVANLLFGYCKVESLRSFNKLPKKEPQTTFMANGTKLVRVQVERPIVQKESLVAKLSSRNHIYENHMYSIDKTTDQVMRISQINQNTFYIKPNSEQNKSVVTTLTSDTFLHFGDPKVIYCEITQDDLCYGLTHKQQQLLNNSDIIHANPRWCVGENNWRLSSLNKIYLLPSQIKEFDLAEFLNPGGLLCIWTPSIQIQNIYKHFSKKLKFQKCVHGFRFGVDDELYIQAGSYLKQAHYTCLVFSKGQPTVESRTVLETMEEVLLVHSEKPDDQYRFLLHTVSKLCSGKCVSLT